MQPHENYLDSNKRLWNERTKHHLKSEFYDLKSFLNGANSLNQIELELLGDVKDKTILHLQCHFGQDSLSLSRMGAKVTGVDFSEEAILAANNLTSQLVLNAQFICCDLYDFPNHNAAQFDVVFTSYGTIGWLPDIDKWAAVVANSLKQGGSFVFVEFHPVVWMFDNQFQELQYAYFKREPIVEEEGTYTDTESSFSMTSIGWNHSIDEVLQPLLDNGLQLLSFKEFDYSPYNVFPDMMEVYPKRFQFKTRKGIIPLVYALKMVKV